MKKITSLFIFCLTLLLVENTYSQTFPKETWQKIQHTDFYGWRSDLLNQVQEYVVDSTATTGMMVIHEGRVMFQYGNISENSYIASCRKSILAMLYGKYVSNGTIHLDETLEELGIDQQEQLLDIEKKARIKDLISARSGVYLPSSNSGDMQHLGPKRGSMKPGEYWLYNNWDFNMAGHIFEMKTKRNIYDEIESQFAVPLSMQDWDRTIQEKSGDLTASDILAYHIWFSARDMARLGLLMLNHGKWDDQQIIEKEWVEEMTTAKSTFEDLDQVAPFINDDGTNFSYGYMWWLWDTSEDDIMHGAYSAQGAYGQNITVIPNINTVIVIKTNALYERQYGNHHTLIRKVAKSYNSQLDKKLKSLANALNEEDIAPFISAFQENTPPKNLLDFQSILNNMGYYYVERKEYTEALKIFELNVKLNPDTWNAYDSQAEAYFLLKNYSKALASYEKAILLNPKNQFNNNERVEYICKRIQSKLKGN